MKKHENRMEDAVLNDHSRTAGMLRKQVRITTVMEESSIEYFSNSDAVQRLSRYMKMTAKRK